MHCIITQETLSPHSCCTCKVPCIASSHRRLSPPTAVAHVKCPLLHHLTAALATRGGLGETNKHRAVSLVPRPLPPPHLHPAFHRSSILQTIWKGGWGLEPRLQRLQRKVGGTLEPRLQRLQRKVGGAWNQGYRAVSTHLSL